MFERNACERRHTVVSELNRRFIRPIWSLIRRKQQTCYFGVMPKISQSQNRSGKPKKTSAAVLCDTSLCLQYLRRLSSEANPPVFDGLQQYDTSAHTLVCTTCMCTWDALKASSAGRAWSSRPGNPTTSLVPLRRGTRHTLIKRKECH